VWRCRGGPHREARETWSYGARLRVPDGRVSRAAAEAWSDSAMGGAAATPTTDSVGLDKAPRNRSEAEVSRSRRVWASGCVFLRLERGGIGRPAIPTSGRRKTRPEVRNRRDPIKGGGCGLARQQPAGAPQARCVGGRWLRRELALGGDVGRQRVAAVEDRGRRASTHGDGSDAGYCLARRSER